MADYSKLTKKELIMTLYARDLMLENERKRLEYLTEKCFELKQQLHDLPKNILKDIQENFDWKQCCEIRKYYDQQYIWFNYVAFNDFLDTILEKFGGKDEINND